MPHNIRCPKCYFGYEEPCGRDCTYCKRKGPDNYHVDLICDNCNNCNDCGPIDDGPCGIDELVCRVNELKININILNEKVYRMESVINKLTNDRDKFCYD